MPALLQGRLLFQVKANKSFGVRGPDDWISDKSRPTTITLLHRLASYYRFSTIGCGRYQERGTSSPRAGRFTLLMTHQYASKVAFTVAITSTSIVHSKRS